MKKKFIIFLILAITSLLWIRQHAQRQSVSLECDRLAAYATELVTHNQEIDAARQTAEELSMNLKSQLASRNAATAQAAAVVHLLNPPLAQPDPAHQGGWPAGVGYCYLPKHCLTNASYMPINNGRLTDEAAALLGMSAEERSAVDYALTNMLGQFRQLELKSMQPIKAPDSWASATFGAKLEAVVAYQIPDLGADATAARQSFSQQLEQTIGASRAQLLGSGADSYLRQNLDDLGARDRVIGFLSVTEQDGSPAVWYGVADALHGEGSFQRVPDDLDPNSQMAYYASLFGVKLPSKQ